MDPLSQASFGASLSQSFASGNTKTGKSSQLIALVIGALAGMAPDLDIFIRSETDPLLFLEFHRQFTHSLIFIPFGALICALVLYPFSRKKLSFAKIYLFSLLGYATHGLLDACTSYGTQLFWPFSNVRVAWNTVSIIDPLFTLPILLFISIALFKKRPVYARIAFAYAIVFLSLGLVQKDRAETAMYTLAQERGHTIERMHIKPSFGNRHVWKLIYEYDGRYYVDAVRLLLAPEIIKGTSIQKLNVKRDFPWLSEDSQQAKDIERFRWFSDGFLAVSTHNQNLIIDMRYSYIPNRISTMWGVELDRDYPEEHVEYLMNGRPTEKVVQRFIEMVF